MTPHRGVDRGCRVTRLSHNCRIQTLAMVKARGLEQCMLVVEGLTCRFGTKAAVDNASFSIAPGGFVGVIGRSGAGKSTLLRMINRLAEPSSGKIRFGDLDVTALAGKARRDWRARAAMIFQQFHLVPRLDVLTNVLIGRLAHRSALPSLLGL